MERRVRSDAVLARLPKEQREQLKGWLLEERLSLRDVQQKLQTEFHLKISHVAISRHDRRLRQQEMLADFSQSLESAGTVASTDENLVKLGRASMALLAHQTYVTLERGQCEPEMLWRLSNTLVRMGDLRVREQRWQLAVYKAQDKVMTKAMLEAEKLRPVWEAANMDPEYRRMEGMLKFNPWMPPEVEAQYQRLKAEHEARRCPHCEQLQPKGWDKVKENQAKIEEILLGTPEERARSQAEVQAQQAVIWEQIQREQNKSRVQSPESRVEDEAPSVVSGQSSVAGTGKSEARMTNDEGNAEGRLQKEETEQAKVQSPTPTPTEGVRGSHPPTDAQVEARSEPVDVSLEGSDKDPHKGHDLWREGDKYPFRNPAPCTMRPKPPAPPGFEWVGDFAMREVSKYGDRAA